MTTFFKKLNNITYPVSIRGSYTFRNSSEALRVIEQDHGYLNKKGSFISRHPNDDPNQQRLGAAINYYLFGISNKDCSYVRFIKKRYLYTQDEMFAYIPIKKNRVGNNICPSLKEICKFNLRKLAAIKLDLLREDIGYNPRFKPLLVFDGCIREDSFLKYLSNSEKDNKHIQYSEKEDNKKVRYSKKKFVEWNPQLVSLLKSITHDIPRTLQHYVNLKNPECFKHYKRLNRRDSF